jgi:putative ABC transport system permease protein
MVWIALKMLTGDKAKFFGIVLGLTFAALLIDQQGSIFCGLMCRTAGQIYDITGADLWVMDANVRYIDDVKPMIENDLYRVRGVPGVAWAVPLSKGQARAKVNSVGLDIEAGAALKQAQRGGPVPQTQHKIIEQVILLGLDDATLVGAPPRERILVGDLADLRKPDAVFVDFTRLDKLYPGEDWASLPQGFSFQDRLRLARERIPAWIRHAARESVYNLRVFLYKIKVALARLLGQPLSDPTRYAWKPWRPAASPIERKAKLDRERFYRRFLGRQIEMNDHRAVIVGVCEATRTFQSNAVIYTTYSRAKRFAPQERKVLTYVLAKAEPGADPQTVAQVIRRRTGLKARTSQEFIWDTMRYFMRYTGIPVNFGITTLLGFLVGTAIAGQTFYNFTLENIRQFGALKAMGTTNLRIVLMVLVQATVVGLLGYGLGVGLAAIFGLASSGGELAFYTPWQLLPITGGAVVLICILASIVSLRRVVVLEPAVVFRG